MSDTFVIHDRILDPFCGQLFDYNTRYSNHAMERELNKYLNIFENNSVLEGLKVTSYSATTSAFTITVSPGRLVHDQTLFKIPNSTDITFELFNHHDIMNVSVPDQYFEISGDYTTKFKQFLNFSITDSTGNNDNNWVVYTSEYHVDTNRTRIFVATPIYNSAINGRIGYRFAYDTNLSGKLLLYTNYKFTNSPINQPLSLCVSCMKNDGTIFGGWSHDTNKILLSVFTFETTYTEIITSTFAKVEQLDPILIDSRHYVPYN